MNQRKPPPSLEDLDARLRKARGDTPAAGQAEGMDRKAPMRGLGLAFRVATELITALVVGVGIGFLVDLWLGTKPWFFISFMMIGAAAGILNVFRLLGHYSYAAGYKKRDEKQGDRPGEPPDETQGN